MANPIQSLHGEIWKPVVGYEGLYDVSNLGRVKSLERVVPHRRSGFQLIKERILRPTTSNAYGHLHATFCRNGKRTTLSFHRLVLEAFVGPCPKGMECCHNDGDPANNRLENLRWDTHEANEADKLSHGTLRRGEQISNAKITEADVRAIRARCDQGETPPAVAADYGIDRRTVSHIVLRRTWAHV